MHDHSAITTFLFSDIEGSTQLWEREPARMEGALARHDALARAAVEGHRGHVVKMTGDGMCAAFDDPQDAVAAALEFQQALAKLETTGGLALRARCGLHAGIVERRDNDFFGTVLNRAARIMAAAHGGQVLVSQALSVLLSDRLPPGIELLPLGAVRLRDLASPESVFQVLHPSLRREFPALRSLSSTPNNLPQQVTSFIGRDRELSELRRGLRKGRLVTILGAGGLGKTRLSLQAAADVMDDYPDGIWLVELAPIADARMVPQAIASVLGVKEETGRPVSEALIKAVGDRRLLLILDNCEHLLAACADVCRRLLQAGPHLRILASSREPLHVAGETTFPLPALAMPDVDQTVAPSALAQYEAVHLFVDRAAAALPSFRVTDQNATAIVDICRRLDGIPLAIELAAARVRALSVQAIAERLTNRFGLLTGGDRTALPRQQTLRASIDWSHDLLTDKERILFRRLAVFAGGWTLEAAERVAAGDEVAEGEVLGLLADLVDKSLVMVDAGRRAVRISRNGSPVRDGAVGESRRTATPLARGTSPSFSPWRKTRGPSSSDRSRAPALVASISNARTSCSAHACAPARQAPPCRPAGSCRRPSTTGSCAVCWISGIALTVEALAIPVAHRARPRAMPGALGRGADLQLHRPVRRRRRATCSESLAIARHHDDRRMIAAVLQNYLAWPRSVRAIARRPAGICERGARAGARAGQQARDRRRRRTHWRSSTGWRESWMRPNPSTSRSWRSRANWATANSPPSDSSDWRWSSIGPRATPKRAGDCCVRC